MRQILFAGAVLGVLGVAACGDKQPEAAPGGTTPPPPVPACVVNAEAVAAAPACLADKDCPCGAHCDLGKCIASCSASGDCDAGESCDRFGRCRGATAVGMVPPSAHDGAAGLKALQPVVYGGATGEAEVRFVASKVDAGEVRVAASPELEVRCETGGTYAAECTVPGAVVGEEVGVWVRQKDGPGRQAAPSFTTGTLKIYEGASLSTVAYATVPFVADLDGKPMPVTPPSLPIPSDLEGRYGGQAEVVEQVLSTAPLLTTPGTAVAGRPPVPIGARLHVDTGGITGTLVIEDPHRLLHPSGEWVGEVSGVDLSALTPSSGSAAELASRVGTAAIRFPSHMAIDGAFSASDVTQIAVVPTVGNVTVRDDAAGGITLRFDVVLSYEGVLPGTGTKAGLPQRRLRFILRRLADLPATAIAPVVPLPVTAPNVTTIASAPTAWEESLAVAADGWAYAYTDNTDPVMRSWFVDRDASRLEACVQPTVDQAAMYAALPFSPYLPLTLAQASATWTGVRAYTQSATKYFVDQPIRTALHSVLDTLASTYGSAGSFTSFTAQSDLGISTVKMMHRLPKFGGGYANVDAPAGMPCVLSVRGQSATYKVRGAVTGAATANVESLITMPTCEDLAAHLGCTPAQGTSPICSGMLCTSTQMPYLLDAAPTLSYAAAAVGPGGSYTIAFSIQGTTPIDACVMPVAPVKCGEYMSCYVDDASAGASGGLDLTAGLGRISGDFVCAEGTQGAGLPLDVLLDLPEGNAARAAGDIFTSCVDDLEAFMTAPPSAPATVQSAIGNARSCIEPARFVNALGYLSRYARARSNMVDTGAPAVESARALRLLQRWMQLHTYVAREAVEAEQLADILRNDGVPVVEPADVLAEGLRAWNLLFHPRFASLMRMVHGRMIADPDYRDRLYGSTPPGEQPYHEQSVGLAVAILETAAAQLELSETVLSQSLFAGSRARLADVGGLLSRVDLGMVFAQYLLETATGALGAAPAWKPAYDRAQSRATAAYGRVLTAMRAVDSHANPFGIEDDDLPLYFLGTEAGPGGRFAAISDFLIGTGPGSTAWAPVLVGQAQTALTAARNAWTQQQNRELAVLENGSEHTARVNALRTRYGGVLADLCGRPNGATTEDLLDWPVITGAPFRPEVCYAEIHRPECVVDENPYLAALTKNDVAFHLMKNSMLNFEPVTSTANLVMTPDEVLTYFRYCTPASVQYPAACTMFAGNNCVTCSTSSGPNIEMPVSISAINFLAARTLPPWFSYVYDASAQSYFQQTAIGMAMSLYPTPKTQLQALEPDAVTDPTCYRGALGQEVLTIRALLKDVDIARARAEEFTESYEISMRVCSLEGQAEANALNLNEQIAAILALRVQLAITQSQAASVRTCDAAAWAISTAAAVFFMFEGVATCTALEATKLHFSEQAKNVAAALEDLETKHAKLMRTFDLERQACAKEAELELVGVRTATLEIERALLELDKAQARYADLRREAQAAYDEGRAAVAEAEAEPMLRPGNDAWLSESIQTYTRKFRLARRATYLAVRAAEYEFQMSMSARGNVLAAEIPDDLDTVLEGLWAESATRSIRGRRPADLKAIVSLKDEILQLGDMSATSETPGVPAAGYQNLSDVEKLRLILGDERFEVYDDTGAYLGQRIPFSLAPLGKLGLGEENGIALLASNDCAERLWSVNASILGEDGLYLGSGTTFTRIELHKKNTFYSQWCNVPAASASDFQTASVRPSKNLFHEPGVGAEVGEVLVPEGADYTSARIEAYFNVARAAFEADDYANGDTSELAARGLYGEYWLFFPASVLASYDADGKATGTGLDLTKVTDVLLRLDYVSVARN